MHVINNKLLCISITCLLRAKLLGETDAVTGPAAPCTN